MTESDKSHISDSLHDFFKKSDDVIDGNGSTIEYHSENIAPPTARANSPETDNEDPYIEFTRMKDNPNEGMVIVQMDDGGPRMKRTRPTEIVIPLDPVSSSESLGTTSEESGGSTDSSNMSSNAGEHSSMQLNENSGHGNSRAGKTDGYSSPSNPAKTCKLDQKSTPSSCNTPKYIEPGLHISGSERSELSYITPIGEHSHSGDDSSGEIKNIYNESTGEAKDTVGSADEKERATSSGSRSSDSGSEINSSSGLSKESLLNICKKFRTGGEQLEEIEKARDRLRRYTLRTQPQRPLSDFVALRMFSSFSANYRFRNTGYVDLDSQFPRPTSATLESVINQFTPSIGDTVEIHHNNVRPLPIDQTQTENDSSSPVCSTRFDSTPAAHSKIEGALTAFSDAANGTRSVESGRKNPQAKDDNEVRCTKTKEMPFADFQKRQPQKVLPPISTGTDENTLDANKKSIESRDKTVMANRKPFVMPQPAVKLPQPDYHTRKKCSNMKPGIPRQLRSIACYQDGKVEVSITGDKRLIPESEPLNVNITFIHRHDTLSTKKDMVSGAADDKNETTSQNKIVPPPKKSIEQSDELPATTKKPLGPLKNPPRSYSNKSGQSQSVGLAFLKNNISSQGQTIPRRKHLPPLQNVPEKMKKDIQTTKRESYKFGQKTQTTKREPNNYEKKKHKKKFVKKWDQLNWDIVRARAQWPPFNTYINQEASERHQKLFADIPV